MLITNQLGVMNPSHGLILCSKVLETINTKKYITTPINSTLKGARIDFVWIKNETIMPQYFPIHSIFHNNDSLEEGSRQLVANYFYYVFSKLGKYGKLATKSFTSVAISNYLDFLTGQLQAGRIGAGRDVWNQDFTIDSQTTNYVISTNYYAPEEWRYNNKIPRQQVQDWVKNQISTHKNVFPELEEKHRNICAAMGMT